MPDRIRLLATTPRLPPGLLSWAGWEAARGAPVYAADPHAPAAAALRAAGVGVTALAVDDPRAAARALRDLARGGREIVWLAGPDGNPELVRALGDLIAREQGGGSGGGGGKAELEVVYGSWDPPGARLLDVVAVMDRLRSPGGCPWDAEQTHDSLRRYLLEEAYEAYDALVDDDLDALREELGDVLLQVAFHARLAEEDATEPWGIDDVAAGLVDKLVRRHPHVFAERSVSGAPEVESNWEQIKRAEKGRTSVTEGLARSQPALALAQALVRRAGRHSLPVPDPAADPGDVTALGNLLLALVSAAERADLDAEAALRAASDRYAVLLRLAEI
ncbi:MAG: MazG family protein [Geodermatophilaceae bacterium]|nr:MazG family protein [Geodermatophilaceae bacterium]